jgi:hypothetical protein
MIEYSNSPSTLQAEWQEVIRMRERMDHLVIATLAFDPVASPVFSNILYNLPLQLAINVLKKAIRTAREERQIQGADPDLGRLLNRGTELTARSKLMGDEQCLQKIADIEAQLLAWGIITAVKPANVQ